MQLICQHCEQPGVVAFIKNYSIDPTGSTSLTVTFTNQANSAVDMVVPACLYARLGRTRARVAGLYDGEERLVAILGNLCQYS